MKKTYTEDQIADWLQLAQEVGIGKARRQLGYPNSWITGKKWGEARGINLEVDAVKARAAATREWYVAEDKLLVCQEGLDRIHEALTENDLTPDDIKKLSDAAKRFIETMNLIEGKATSIAKDESNAADDLFAQAMREFQTVDATSNVLTNTDSNVTNTQSIVTD